MQKKELYLSKSLEGLEPHYSLDSGVIRKPINQLLQSLQKMIKLAEENRINRDEEMSYVLYMKFMNLLSKLQKNPDFSKQKGLITKMIGTNNDISKHLDHMEKLKASLKERYATEIPAEQMPTAETIVMNVDQDENLDDSKPQDVREVVDCTTLYSMFNSGEKLLIMDCRSAEHYDQSKMDYKYTVNVPEEILKLGMTASKIQELLPNDSKVFWNMRENRHYIIFVDWSSKRFNRNSPVWHLKEILMEWDQDVEKKPKMLLLEGGYEKWKTVYPMKCFNPQFSPPKMTNGDTPAIEDIEYPNWEDIQMKNTSTNTSMQPQVDRSMKLNAMKAYESTKSPLQLLEENEQLMDKSLKNERELLTLETSLKQIVSDKENNEDSNALSQTFLFKIWELKSKLQDFNVEEKSIKEQLDLSKDQIREPKEISKVMQVEQHLREMEMERKRVQMEREQKSKELEEAMKFARDRKPSFNDHKTPQKSQRKEEIILSPKALNQVNTTIPSFDRAAKPIQTVSRQTYSDQDFLPVYGRVERGLTGLKNLGNSCYMNSIIQCLSNTSTLTDFLLDNKHEKHVNNCNKTKGHIVRTLAAVIKMLWKGDCKYISSKHLKAAIGEQDHLFYGMDQQDSHEFLIMLIDWLQSDLQTITVQSTIEALPASEKAWLEYTKAKESFILRLFYGQIKSTVKCTECSKESATYETFSNLSLELPLNNTDHCHISECFSLYFHGEVVKGWNCSHCKAPREAIKKLDISKLPPVLVIHLKRFYADPYMNSTFRKKNMYVDFPLADLNMMPYVARTEKNNGSNSKHIYNLYAVSNHYGTMESGHYTAFCKNYMQEKWHKFDDHTVSPLERSDVKSSAAYILFYTINDDERRRRY